MTKSEFNSVISTQVGGVIAAILSWMKWHSLGWAIVHYCFGWFYVIYYFFQGY